jgi:hypothetical protein
MVLILVGAALLAGCKYDHDNYKTPTDPGQQYLQATATASSLPADGISTVNLSARISADATLRTIKFTASLGTLVGGTGSPSSLQVTADSDGVARVVLRSSKDLGTCLITVEVVTATIAAQTIQVAFVAPDPGSILRFVSVPGNVLADGTTATPITLAVAAGLPSGDARKVTLTTALGSFSPTAAMPSLDVTPSPADNTATVLLYSPQQAGLSTLSAEVSGTQRTTIISFDRALPDAIRVDLDKLTVPNTTDASVNVAAYLTRRTGKVSLDTRVSFEALANGVSVGRFVSQDNLSDADGTVTAVFSPAGAVTPGPVTIKVSVEGGSATGSAELAVTAPP